MSLLWNPLNGSIYHCHPLLHSLLTGWAGRWTEEMREGRGVGRKKCRDGETKGGREEKKERREGKVDALGGRRGFKTTQSIHQK